MWNFKEVPSCIEKPTVIIPTISVGNVPQLTVDLLVVNTGAKKIGKLWHKAFIPFIGASPMDQETEESQFANTVEVYYAEKFNMVLFQIRSQNTNQKYVHRCFTLILDQLKSWDTSRVVILTSMDDCHRFSCEIEDTSEFGRCRYIESQLFTEKFHESQIKNLPWKCYLQGRRSQDATFGNPLCLKYNGASFTDKLFSMCSKKNLSAIVLLTFATDGLYNDSSSENFFKFINLWLRIKNASDKLIYPESWKFLRLE